MSSREYLPVAIVAESDDETRLLIRSLLEFLGFAVVEARDGPDAYESAVCYQPDLILLELKLPLVRDFAAIRRIKKEPELRNVQIIAISANNNSGNRNLALAAGCSAHLEKPIEFDRLELVVGKLVQCERLANVSALVH